MSDKIPAVFVRKVVLQVRVIVVDTRVNNCHVHILRACAECPCLRGVDGLHSPQTVIFRVIGDFAGFWKVERVSVVEGCCYDAGIVPDSTEKGVLVLSVRVYDHENLVARIRQSVESLKHLDILRGRERFYG